MDNGETGITDVLGAKPAAGNARRSAHDPAAPLADKDATGPDRTPWLKVSVLWGNLTEVPADVHMTGHYAGVAPTSAEKALDEAISGGDRHIVAERNRRGWIDARLGRITYFPTPSPPPRPAPDGAEGCAIHAAAVIGMGRMGGFTEQRAVRLYESLLGEVLGAGHMRKVATVLIGSKPGSLKLRQAARALVRGFDAALDSMGAPPGASATAWGDGQVTYYPIVGMDQPTPQSVRVRDGSTEYLWDLEGRGLAGDGTVPGISAYLEGTQDARVFTPQLHSRLQAEGAMLHHVRGLLGSLDQPSPKDLRSAAPVWFSYRGEDVYLTDDRVTVELGAESHFSESQLPVVEATVVLHNRSTRQTPVHRTVTVARTPQTLDLGTLPAGTYELHVSGEERTVPLSDVLVVAEVPDEDEQEEEEEE
ncbi:hypothetical protein [Streptomyces rubiginosohelvolus]|uniref:hypothetical protein n=1 Tax=Streptomyces rubiginosohelvolus TaxID=67362 RepID=UPI00371BCE3C